jgi:Na+-transporting NADH:ubiquinone oxidoreductase subunit NqrF
MINNKGQISLEMLIIVGVVILVVVLFATYYLTVINKNILRADDNPDSAQEVNRFIENTIVTPNTTAPIPIPATCGNGTIDPLEVCDTQGAGFFPAGMTCTDIGQIGTLQCNNCIEITCS